jgi:Protein of unknown function (DUF3795)
MMQEILSRCGYRCDLCLAYRPNVESNPSNPQTLSDGWFKYFGFRIPAEQIICDGCMAEAATEAPRLIDRACPVRPCVIERAVPNCSQCPDYGCERLVERWVVFEDVAARVEGEISEEDRARFIFPYENKRRLDDRRRQARSSRRD